MSAVAFPVDQDKREKEPRPVPGSGLLSEAVRRNGALVRRQIEAAKKISQASNRAILMIAAGVVDEVRRPT